MGQICAAKTTTARNNDRAKAPAPDPKKNDLTAAAAPASNAANAAPPPQQEDGTTAPEPPSFRTETQCASPRHGGVPGGSGVQERQGDHDDGQSSHKSSSTSSDADEGVIGSPSKLSDTQRRRLSVSTVKPPPPSSTQELPTPSATQPPSGKSLGGPVPVVGGQRNPLSEILEKLFAKEEITVKTIAELIPPSLRESSTLIFGFHKEDSRLHGFDDKEIQQLGDKRMLDGLGYSCKKGLKPESPNQDDFCFIRTSEWSLYGIFDGHGPSGHHASSFVHWAIPYLILADSAFETDPMNVIKDSFVKAHHLLEVASENSSPKFDCTLSGTTACVILHRFKERVLCIAHAGDSRAVLGRRGSSGAASLMSVDLTQDHKATLPEEQQRIEASGGEVRLLQGDVPHRVFIKNHTYPGLAMSRAIGDTIGNSIGVTAEPSTSKINLTSDDAVIIIATDGVWEFISSQEAIDFIAQKKKQHVQKAAEFLAYESWRRWVEEEQTVVDDVTCIIFWI